MDEVLKLLSALTGDDRFVSLELPKERGAISMCDLLDSFISKGIEQGIEQGMAQGLEQGESQGDARTLIKCVESLIKKD